MLLRDGGRWATGRTTLARNVLASAQIAFTVVLLIGAGLFVRSLVNVTGIDTGFEMADVIGVQVTLPADVTQERTDIMMREAHQRLQGLPGVESVAIGQSAPFRPSLNARLFIPGHERLPNVGRNTGIAYPTFFAVTPEYFDVMGIDVLRGRGIEASDVGTSERVMLVDADFARIVWPGQDAIGQCVRIGSDTIPCSTVIGIVEPTKRTVTGTSPSLRFYIPLSQTPDDTRDRYLFVRSDMRNRMLVSVRATVSESIPNALLVDAFPFGSLAEWQFRPWRLGTSLFIGFGIISTVIAIIGLYGSIAFDMKRRQREIGVRMALGAAPFTIVRYVIAATGRRAAAGVIAGLAIALYGGRYLQEVLFQTDQFDPLVHVAVVLIVVLSTLIASAVPVLKAVRVDPTVTLRTES